VLVSPEGKVAEAHVLIGHPLLAAAALKAVRNWLYRPLQTRSGPVQFLVPVEVKFSLRFRKVTAMPAHADEDLSRQVHLPEIIKKSDAPMPSSSIRMRVLVNEQGQAVDSELLSGRASAFNEANQTLEDWRFRPARWGAMAIPWYLEVDVPGRDSLLSSTAPHASSR
jgi:hypothetical protein